MLPAYFGLFAAVAIGSSRSQYLSALTIGIFLWFFSDTIGDSSYLGVNAGLSGGIAHLGLVVFFALALVSLFVVEGRMTKTHSISDSGVVSSHSFAIPFLVAIALSIHGLGEGVAFGGAAASTSSTSLIAAFGGYGPAVSYSLHKVLEPIAIGASYSAFVLNRSGVRQASRRWKKDLYVAGLAFVIPTLIGTAGGYFAPFDTTYLFALGAGASVYVLFKLVQALFEQSNPFRSYRESLRIALLALLGFLLIYAAAIFHSMV